MNLMDDLRLLEKRTDDKKRSGAMSKKAEALTEQAGWFHHCSNNVDTYQKKIRLISAEIAALDSSISLMDKEIDGQRANLGGIHAASQNNDAILKSIRVLENRLDSKSN
jgi:predicted RNase H-like nuclease (RuvC/YqgF family)